MEKIGLRVAESIHNVISYKKCNQYFFLFDRAVILTLPVLAALATVPVVVLELAKLVVVVVTSLIKASLTLLDFVIACDKKDNILG